MSFDNRTIAKVDAFANKPVREDYETEEAYLADLKEWEDAQKGPNPGGHEEDAQHGPGVTGWINPDSVTGPGVEEVKTGHTEDVEHGPGVE